jgi:hypothetical protein
MSATALSTAGAKSTGGVVVVGGAVVVGTGVVVAVAGVRDAVCATGDGSPWRVTIGEQADDAMARTPTATASRIPPCRCPLN